MQLRWILLLVLVAAAVVVLVALELTGSDQSSDDFAVSVARPVEVGDGVSLDSEALESVTGPRTGAVRVPVSISATEEHYDPVPDKSDAEGPAAPLVDDLDLLFEVKYEGASRELMERALRDADVAYQELKELALQEKRSWGDFLVGHQDDRGFVHRPEAIPPGVIYRSIASPMEAVPDPQGRTVIWHLFLEREQYPEIYHLSAERKWLRHRLEHLD